MPDAVLNPVTTLLNATGALIVKNARDKITERQEMQGKVERVYTSTPGFSRTVFRLFLRGPLQVLTVLGAAVALVAALTILVWLGGAMGWTLPPTLKPYAKIFSITVAGAVLVSILANVAVPFEASLRFNVLRHWLPRRGVERILANRVRNAVPGVFKVNLERCEALAGAIAAKLRADPGCLFSTPLEKRPEDPAAMANEVFLGEMFESAMFREFGGRWERLRPLQSLRIEAHPACSPSALGQLAADEWVRRVASFFLAAGVRLSPGLEEALRLNVARLRKRFQGNALCLFEFPPPRRAILVPSLAAMAVLLSLASGFPGLATLSGQTYAQLHRTLFQLGAVAAGAASLSIILMDGRAWLDWAARLLRLEDKFEQVQRRVRPFEIYRDYPMARVALAKFAYEYGLLAVPPEQLRLGGAAHITLSLLKTGVVWTDLDDLGASDEDLLYFCESAMRHMALRLRRLLSDTLREASSTFPGVADAQHLKGEYDPYNIVDGFLFLVGSKECAKDACADADSNCPFASLHVCDSGAGERFRYDRDARRFLREEQASA